MAESTAFKLYDNLKNLFLGVFENISEHTYEFENGVWLYDLLLQLIADSPTARVCADKLDKYLKADGFADQKAVDFPLNPDQKGDKLLAELVTYERSFEGFAFVIREDYPSMKVQSVHIMPFEKITKRIDGNFWVNPRRRNEYGYMKSQNILYAPWKPDTPASEFRPELERQIKKHGKQIGRILYVYDRQPGADHYPVPVYYAGESDIRADAEYSRLELFKVLNNFDASVVIETDEYDRKQPRDASGKITGLSPWEKFRESLKKFMARDFRQRASIFHIERKTGSEPAKVHTLNTMAQAPDMNAKRFGVAQAVCRSFQVPGVLANLYQPGSIGDTKKIADEIALFNSTLTSRQQKISDALKLIHPDIDWTITTHNPVQYLDPAVLAKMTDDEIRLMGGLQPLEKPVSSDIEKTVNSLNTLSPLVATKVLESMTKDEIRSLINLGPAPEPDVEPSSGSKEENPQNPQLNTETIPDENNA